MIDLTVDIAFPMLLIVCGVRYSVNHALDSFGAVVLGAAALSWAAYASGTLASPSRVRGHAGVMVAVLIWILLVVAAPSFAWCALPLFFTAHRVFSGSWALGLTAAIVVAVGVSLFRWSSWTDIGMLIGPLVGGGVLTIAYAALERLVTARGALILELGTAQLRLAAVERDVGAEAERHRLAAELHDTVLQGTASALLLLEAEEERRGETSPDERSAQDVLRANLIEARRLVSGLSSAILEDGSLEVALTEVVATGIGELHVMGIPRRLPAGIAHTLLRIAQEANANAMRHASATRIVITLTFGDDIVGIDVGDNGVGFDATSPSSTEGGYGLRAMRWRAESAGGAFDVQPGPGGGTIVSALIPVSATDAAEIGGAG